MLQHIVRPATDIGELAFIPEPGAEIDDQAPGLVIGAEQSNTSIVYGNSSILKVFRRLEPGPNPDAEVHRALHAAGSAHIAPPLGVIEGPVAGERTTLALLTEFFAGSAEGWAMATASVRDLMAEGDLRADEVGGDFAAESLRLGRAVAEVHADLANAFGTRELDERRDRRPHRVDGRQRRRVADLRAVGGRAPGRRSGPPSTGRQHEAAVDGRPAGPADPRRPAAGPDAAHADRLGHHRLRGRTVETAGRTAGRCTRPLRDVAGMLRSFDYAANHSGGAIGLAARLPCAGVGGP